MVTQYLVETQGFADAIYLLDGKERRELRPDEKVVLAGECEGALAEAKRVLRGIFKASLSRQTEKLGDYWLSMMKVLEVPLAEQIPFPRGSLFCDERNTLRARVADLEEAMESRENAWREAAFRACAGVIPTPVKPSENPMRPGHLNELAREIRTRLGPC